MGKKLRAALEIVYPEVPTYFNAKLDTVFASGADRAPLARIKPTSAEWNRNEIEWNVPAVLARDIFREQVLDKMEDYLIHLYYMAFFISLL